MNLQVGPIVFEPLKHAFLDLVGFAVASTYTYIYISIYIYIHIYIYIYIYMRGGVDSRT